MTSSSRKKQLTQLFWRNFLHVLSRQPRRALAALYWYVTGRKVRARNRLRLSFAQSPLAYTAWIKTIERQGDALAASSAVSAPWRVRPVFSVLIHENDLLTREALERLILGLDGQCYTGWELLIVPSSADGSHQRGLSHSATRVASNPATTAAEALSIGIAEARGDYILPLIVGVDLPPTALYHYAEALQTSPDADLVYGDHDHIDAEGQRIRPWFKPRWNEEMFLAQDYLSNACVIRTGVARRGLPIASEYGEAALYALLLRITPAAYVVHVPHVTAHFGFGIPDQSAETARLAAVRQAMAEAGDGAEADAGPFGTIRVQWPLPTPTPLVSVIVPTRDHVVLLRACIDGVLHRTNYRPIEIIIVDNGSVDRATLAYFDALSAYPEVRILPFDRPYNYSEINNFAVAHARGDYLCLLNNDTDVIDDGWLTELMRHAVRPRVGAVGAMLLYDDGSIQHAGVAVGLGTAAGHAHRFLPRGDPGYFRYAHVPHYVSAVTAACLVVARQKFDAVGGLDEQELAIAFNDVDLCLKLQAAGWRNVYAPQAVMVHHESKSRGKDISPRHIDRYRRELGVLQKRWSTIGYVDPLHHPQLDPSAETFIIQLEHPDNGADAG